MWVENVVWEVFRTYGELALCIPAVSWIRLLTDGIVLPELKLSYVLIQVIDYYLKPAISSAVIIDFNTNSLIFTPLEDVFGDKNYRVSTLGSQTISI